MNVFEDGGGLIEMVLNNGDIRKNMSNNPIKLQINLYVDQYQLEVLINTIVKLKHGEHNP